MTSPYSPAVMARRVEPHDSLDDFPTPPWAARALFDYVLNRSDIHLNLPWPTQMTAWEPAANRGHLARGLDRRFKALQCSDVYDYGVGYPVADFLMGDAVDCDFIVTNPPFNLGVEFLYRAMDVAKYGCAFFMRTSWIEGGERDKAFNRFPPSLIAQFSGRVPLIKGYVSDKATTATAYAWFVFVKGFGHDTRHRRIPADARRRLARQGDYPPYLDQARLMGGDHLRELERRHIQMAAENKKGPPMPLDVIQAVLSERQEKVIAA
jgi:hypothetical protein